MPPPPTLHAPPRGGLATLGAWILALGLAWPAPGQAATDHACEGGEVVVHAVVEADAAEACRGARAAVAFLAGLGRPPTGPLRLEIVARLPELVASRAAGCYLRNERRVLLLPLATVRHQAWFGLPVTREVYQAMAAHEVAHAIAACHFRPARPTHRAHEYVAYVAMFGSMPAPLRGRILRANPRAVFDREEEITDLFYLFDPIGFGVAAWRHHEALADGGAYLRAVLNGDRLAE